MNVEQYEHEHRNSQDLAGLEILESLFRAYGWFLAVGVVATLFLIAYWSKSIHPLYTGADSISRQGIGHTYTATLSVLGAMTFTSIVGSILSFKSAGWIRCRTNWRAIRACSFFICIKGILGICLGVYALSVLNRGTVKAMFDNNTPKPVL